MISADIRVEFGYRISFQLVDEHDLSLIIDTDNDEGQDGGQIRLRFDTPGLLLDQLSRALHNLADTVADGGAL